jgi:hypothetical protein
MRLYSLGEAYTLFAIDPVDEAHVGCVGTALPLMWTRLDHRRRYLDSAQLFVLAEAHSRVRASSSVLAGVLIFLAYAPARTGSRAHATH